MNRLTKRTTNCPLPVLVRDRAFGPAYFVSEEDYTDYRDALMNNIGDVPYKGAVRRVLMSAPTIVPAEGGTDNGNRI